MNNELITLEIVSPSKAETLRIRWVSIDGASGNFVVGPGHLPLLSALREHGSLVYELEDGSVGRYDSITRGVVRVSSESVQVIVADCRTLPL